MSATLAILILGGYGTFGGRLAQLLAADERLTLLIGGRSRASAEEFCAKLGAKAATRAVRFDRDGDVERQLREIGPDIVVDASGPFQSYGSDPYRAVKAAIALGIDYLDLADGSDFVKGISQFDADAKSKGVFVLSGVSSFPVLTAAVVRKLSHDLKSIETITGGIAPSPYAGVGLNVIRAIAGYAGRPVPLRRDGATTIGYPFTDTRRHVVAPPGRVPLRPLTFSLVDVPDLKVLPDLWPDVKTVWLGAGPIPDILHRALRMLAWLVRLKLLPSLSPLAPMMFLFTNKVRWGEHRGGMFVAVEGTAKDGRAIGRSWHLLAEGDDGPLIPSMAAEAIIRNCLVGRRPPDGARPATGDLELSDYNALFVARDIHTGLRETPDAIAPLYRRLLGDAWSRLPEPIRTMHDLDDDMAAHGEANIERGRSWAARPIALVFGFPQEGKGVPVSVSFRARGGAESWQRTFGSRSFTSVQEEGRGRFERLLCERFGPFAFGLALVVDDGKLRLVVRGWTFLGIQLPTWLAPHGDSYEHVENGRFCFHVEIGHPLAGLIVRYRGWLVPDRATQDQRPRNPVAST